MSFESKPKVVPSQSITDQLNELKENFKGANDLVAETFKLEGLNQELQTQLAGQLNDSCSG